MKRIIYFLVLLVLNFQIFALPFNSKLTDEEINQLNNGELLIKNINFKKNISLIQNDDNFSKILLNEIDDLNPKYLAEIIQFKPYEGNENLPAKLKEVLNNVPDYAGIPYYSERTESYWDLYESAEITETINCDDKDIIKAHLYMDPFEDVYETIELYSNENEVLYMAKNDNKLRYLDKFDCVWPERMKICIYLFRDGDNWILYGIGGVNAPRVPFFTERIQTSFINRINTFCSFIFKKF